MIPQSYAALEENRVSFGYVFFDMRDALCFTIGIDKKDVWGVVHRIGAGGKAQWESPAFCPLWWAKSHPATGVAIPDTEGLQQVIGQIVALRLERQFELGGSESAGGELPPGLKVEPTKRRRHGKAEILEKLQLADKLLAEGSDLPEVLRQIDVCRTTYYRWQDIYSGEYHGVRGKKMNAAATLLGAKGG